MKLFSVIVCFSVFTLGYLTNNVVVAKDWWENGNFYQIYPRSFMDSNGDGVGDLNGITTKVDYLKEIGMNGVWLSPIFKSPMADFGYDISDYTQIHHEFGTLEDFDKLVAKCRQVGIKLILDFVPNHTSDEHEWFIKSANRVAGYEDYYIWRDAKMVNGVRSPPNNWISIFRGSAWEYNEIRGQYYLHQFVAKQPDLNYRNPSVVNAMKDVLRLWMSRGVSGFRVDAVPFLFETLNDDGSFPDEPRSNDPSCTDELGSCYLSHIYTQDHPDTLDMAYQWRAVLDDFKKEFGGDTRIMMTEAYTTLDNTIKYYTNGTVNGSHIPFNFELINNIKPTSTAKDYKTAIDSWLNKMPKGYQANWVMGNHDQKRLASRIGGVEKADLLNILLQTLPGIGVTYNGEEIAMTDVYISWEDTVDPAGCQTNPTDFNTFSRDPARTPFQWDDTKNAGFSSADKTWLPVSADYKSKNVKLQRQSPFSHFKIFKALTRIRRTKTFVDGSFTSVAPDDDLLVYTRSLAGSDTFVIVLNLSTATKTVDLTTAFPSLANTRLEVITSSLQSGYVAGDLVNTNAAIAFPLVGTVFVVIP